VCVGDHTLLNFRAHFFISQAVPKIEDYLPNMSTNLIGAFSESLLLKQWFDSFNKYITDLKYRRKINEQIGNLKRNSYQQYEGA